MQITEVANRCGEGIELIALIESVAGVVRMRDIAQCRQVMRLVFGSFDFGVDAGIDGTGRELDYVRSQFVIESRHAGLPPPIGGVMLSTSDAELIAADVLDGRRFGFGSKLCTHPKQVDAVNAICAPTGRSAIGPGACWRRWRRIRAARSPLTASWWTSRSSIGQREFWPRECGLKGA